MNFNYDLATWIDYFIGAFACCLGGFFVGKVLLYKNMKDIKVYSYLIILFLTIFTVFNTLSFDNLAKVFGTMIMTYIICRYIFKQDIINSIIYGLIIYILFIISEATISLIFATIEWLLKVSIMKSFEKSIIINIVISIISIIYAYLIKNKTKIFINKINKDRIFYIIVLGIIDIFIIFSSLYELYISNWSIDYKFILNIIIFIGCLVLTILLIKQYLDSKEMNDKYNLLNDYLKTSAELIEKYSSTIHKYKNNLIAIKGYINNDSEDAIKYIDNLLDKSKEKKYNWFKKINIIRIDSIRYLIYYKLSKAESNNLHITIDISNNINKYDNVLSIKESNILLEIIGELFDNAIYASNESKEKELIVSMFEEKNCIQLIISNSYKDDFDLSLITKNGYTTKGKGHGLGLYDIDKTIKKNNIVKIKYDKIDNYFMATLSIYVKEKNKI